MNAAVLSANNFIIDSKHRSETGKFLINDGASQSVYAFISCFADASTNFETRSQSDHTAIHHGSRVAGR